MKIGDLISLDGYLYPQYKDRLGVIVDSHLDGWIVMISGRLHPYKIDEDDMEARDECR